MLVYAGIDEAGYGPMLGPLCVATSVFLLPDYDAAAGAPDLWKLLAKAVCRSKSDAKHRIAIDDSKALKGSNANQKSHPLKHLERGVLAFSLMRLPQPRADSEWFKWLGVRVADHAWLKSETPVPVTLRADELAIASAKLKRACDAAGVQFSHLACCAIDPEEFNQQVRDAGRKSNVNMTAALRAADAVWMKWPTAHPRVVIDRHGGRTHYRDELQLAWPTAGIRILDETDAFSRYHLRMDGRELTITFAVEGESHHLPIALASMTAKYARELLMGRLNRYFRSHLPELKPTAGYVQDGRRYLRDIEPLVTRLRIDRDCLVRSV
jgi:ribonuclease HII